MSSRAAVKASAPAGSYSGVSCPRGLWIILRMVSRISSWSSRTLKESKVLPCGEGGFNMCKTKETFYKLYSLRNCGRPYEAQPPVFGLTKPVGMDQTLQSGNYRLTEWQAALLQGGLARLDWRRSRA